MRFHFSFILPALLLYFSAQAQDLKYCGTTEKQLQMLVDNPELVIYEDQFRQFIHDWIETHHSETRDETLYVVPIVFHIIHDYGSENISDAQVMDAVRILNEDFRKLNADTSQIVDAFKDVAGDSKIEFRLANKAPDGSCTNGIEHIHSTHTYSGDDNAKLSDWPRDEYLNIWTTKTLENGIAGYAYFPFGAPSDVDGVIVLSNYVGSIGSSTSATSRVVTHEIGHSLGLAHTWGFTNAPGVECGDDLIEDTPETEGWVGCFLNGSICHPGVIENVQNYMEYAYCSRMFTKDQGLAMQGTLNTSTSQRNNLWILSNLIATGTNDTIRALCPPVADFYSTARMVCIGSEITFHDISTNGAVTDRTWAFQDGTPSSSSDKDVVVSFSTPGWKTVTLNVSNSEGSNAITKINSVYVNDTVAQHGIGFFEGFEVASNFQNDWIVFNPEGNSSVFNRTTSSGYNSESCVTLNSYNNAAGDRDQLVSPSYDLSGGGDVYLNFRYSCASQSSSNINDILSIYSSTDCGQWWLIRTSIMNTNLANAGTISSSFKPTSASQWAAKSILFPPYLYQPNVRFMFEYKSNGYGNNFYIDDINVSNYPVGIHDPDGTASALTIFPNPVTENSIAVISQMEPRELSIKIIDLQGRIMNVLYEGWLGEGQHQFDLNASQLSAKGMYLLVLDDGITIQRQKFIVQ